MGSIWVLLLFLSSYNSFFRKNGPLTLQSYYFSGKKPKEIDEYFQKTYGDEKPSYGTITNWCAKFKTGRLSTQDEVRSGHPISAISDALVKNIERIVKENRKISLRVLATMTNSSSKTVGRILNDYLDMKKLYARLVPKNLSDAQKFERVRVARETLKTWDKNWDELSSRLITCDET